MHAVFTVTVIIVKQIEYLIFVNQPVFKKAVKEIPVLSQRHNNRVTLLNDPHGHLIVTGICIDKHKIIVFLKA